MRLAIVIASLNQGDRIAGTLAPLQVLRGRGTVVIVADGGSRDATVRTAADLADQVISVSPGRALQFNAGARSPAVADCDVLLFLRTDARLPADADRLIFRALSNSTRRWGYFNLSLAAGELPAGRPGRQELSPWLPWWVAVINQRARWTGLCAGEQAIFAERGTFLALGGFDTRVTNEDDRFSRRARALTPPLGIAEPVQTSASDLMAQGRRLWLRRWL